MIVATAKKATPAPVLKPVLATTVRELHTAVASGKAGEPTSKVNVSIDILVAYMDGADEGDKAWVTRSLLQGEYTRAITVVETAALDDETPVEPKSRELLDVAVRLELDAIRYTLSIIKEEGCRFPLDITKTAAAVFKYYSRDQSSLLNLFASAVSHGYIDIVGSVSQLDVNKCVLSYAQLPAFIVKRGELRENPALESVAGAGNLVALLPVALGDCLYPKSFNAGCYYAQAAADEGETGYSSQDIYDNSLHLRKCARAIKTAALSVYTRP